MKFLLALLAPSAAVLAAPTEIAAHADNPPAPGSGDYCSYFVLDSMACACINAAGEASPFATCPYGESMVNIGEQSNHCYITSIFARPLEQIMDSRFCAQYVPGYPTAACKPVKLCLRYPQCVNYNSSVILCGYKGEIADFYCEMPRQ